MLRRVLVGWTALIGITGCISVDVPGQDTLFVTGEPFVVRGTATIVDGPCLVWIDENGITYHLFQSTRVANEDYDRVTTPGVVSRLQLATRSDLQVSCRLGTLVEVQRILEIVD